jgi:hypothetical protein
MITVYPSNGPLVDADPWELMWCPVVALTYVYIYVYTYTYKCIYIYTYFRICMYICVYVYNKRAEWEQYLRTNCKTFFSCEVSKGTSNGNDYLPNLPFFHLFQRGDFPQDYQDLWTRGCRDYVHIYMYMYMYIYIYIHCIGICTYNVYVYIHTMYMYTVYIYNNIYICNIYICHVCMYIYI